MAIGKEVASWSRKNQGSRPTPLLVFLFVHLLRPSATWPNGFVLFFFLVWAESRKITKLDLVCLGTMGCSKIMRRENWWFERDKRKRKEFGPNYGLSMILNLLRFLFSLCEERKLMVWAKRGYDDFCDIYVETSLFCGPDYDEINKTSLSFGPRIHNFKSMTKIRKSSWIMFDCDAI